MQRKERGGKERGKWKVSGVSQRQLETSTEQEKVPLPGLKEDACPVFNKTALCILIPNQEESQRASYVRA